MIKIKAEIPHGMKCSLRIGELEKTLDSVDREAVFELDEGRVYDVEAYIGTPARSADEKKFDRLFFSLSLPFRWISALADVVPGRWYDDLCPYSAKVEFKIGFEGQPRTAETQAGRADRNRRQGGQGAAHLAEGRHGELQCRSVQGRGRRRCRRAAEEDARHHRH